MEPSDAKNQFLFFEPSLLLRDAAPDAGDGGPAPYLAWCLLAAGPPSDASRWQEVQRRLSRLRLLLAQVESAEQGGASMEARDLWDLLDAEARALGQLRTLQDWLIEHARLLGPIEEVELLAAKLRAALADELLPILHLKWFLRDVAPRRLWSRRTAAYHQRELANWRIPEPVPPALAERYALYLHTLVQRKGDIPARLDENVRALLVLPALSEATLASLAEGYARVVKKHLRTSLRRCISPEQLSERIERFAETLGYPIPVLVRGEEENDLPRSILVLRAVGGYRAPALLPALEVLSLLYQARGRQCIRQEGTVATGVIDIGLATLFDPCNDLAQGDLWSLRQIVSTAGTSPALEFGSMILEIHCHGDTAAWLEAFYRDAAVQEGTLRLGYDSSHKQHIADLFTAIDEAMADLAQKPPALSTGAFIEQHALSTYPELVELDWRRLRPGLESFRGGAVRLLAHLHEGRDLLPLQKALQLEPAAIPASVARAAELPGRPALWLTGRADLRFKTAAALGLLLLILSGIANAYSYGKEYWYERRYTLVVAALQRGADDEILHASAAFLSSSSSSEDPRVDEIRAVLKDVLRRERSRLNELGRGDEARALERRYGGSAALSQQREGQATP